MGKAQERPVDLAERFLQYLQEERAIELSNLRSADVARIEASKRIRKIDKEIEAIRGGAI